MSRDSFSLEELLNSDIMDEDNEDDGSGFGKESLFPIENKNLSLETYALQHLVSREADVIGTNPETGEDLFDTSDVVVTPEDMTDQSVSSVDDASTIERAIISIQLAYERLNSFSYESGNEEAKDGLFTKIGKFIVAAWQKLVETITKWIGMASNFFRKGGLANKIKIIKEKRNDILKADKEILKKIMVPDPEIVSAVADAKVNNSGVKLGGFLESKRVDQYKNEVFNSSKNIDLSSCLNKAYQLVVDKAVSDKLITGGKAVIGVAKKKLADEKTKATGRRDKRNSDSGNAAYDKFEDGEKQALREFNSYYLLMVRSFSWYITIVNALVRVSKLGSK